MASTQCCETTCSKVWNSFVGLHGFHNGLDDHVGLTTHSSQGSGDVGQGGPLALGCVVPLPPVCPWSLASSTRACQRLLRSVHKRHLASCFCSDLGDAAAHGAGTNNADVGPFPHVTKVHPPTSVDCVRADANGLQTEWEPSDLEHESTIEFGGRVDKTSLDGAESLGQEPALLNPAHP